jgi:cell wall-associated NlpC family hydrolase
MKDIKFITQYAMSMLNVPYLYGGHSPIEGIDCSEFVINLLTAWGFFKPWEDTTAHGLWKWAKGIDKIGSDKPFEGCLVFYGKNRHCSHIAYAISERLTLQASGGGKANKGIGWLERSIIGDARVKMLPFDYRSDVLDIRFPFIKSEV